MYAVLGVEPGMYFGEVLGVTALVVVVGSPGNEINRLYKSGSLGVHEERHFYQAVNPFHARRAILPMRGDLLEELLIR